VKPNKYLVIGIVLALIAAGFLGYQYSASKSALRAAQVVIDAQSKVVETAKQEALAAENRAVVWEKKAHESDMAADEARRRGEQAVSDLQKKLDQIAAAKPNELADEAKRITGEGEIVWNGQNFTLSLSAFRNVVSKLADWENFTASREPSYRDEILSLRKAIVMRDLTIVEKDKIIAAKNMQITAQEAIQKALRDVITHQKSDKFWGGLAKGTIGVLIGFTLATVLAGK